MPIYANPPKEFVPCPEGAHHAVIVDVVDHGLVKASQPGWKDRHVVDVRLQVDETGEDGERYLVIQWFTNTLSKKGKLRKFIEDTRGRALAREELRPGGLDLDALVGLNAQVNVVHRAAEGTDQVFANISSVMPVTKTMPKLTAKDYTRVKDRPSTNGSDQRG
jgi:hypothetical protein